MSLERRTHPGNRNTSGQDRSAVCARGDSNKLGALAPGWRALEARGLARTLFAMAATLALIAVMLPSGAPPDLARNMAILHGVFVALLTASGLLFRHASLAG
jgi:hypothetical protein